MLSLEKDSLTSRITVSVVNSSINHDMFRYLSYCGIAYNHLWKNEGRYILNVVREIAIKMQGLLIELSSFRNPKCKQFKQKIAELLNYIELSYNLWNLLYTNRCFEYNIVEGHTKKANTINRTVHKLLERIAKNVLEHNLTKSVRKKNGNVLV